MLAREKPIDLELINADLSLKVLGHAALLREAALNLLHNAIRFALEGGHVSSKIVFGAGGTIGIDHPASSALRKDSIAAKRLLGKR